MRKIWLYIVFLPVAGFSAVITWEGTTSDLNTPGNWSPAMVPGSTDEALFDSTLPGVNLSPTAAADFSVSNLNFNTSAQAFSFTFNQCVLTLQGAGITGNATNTTLVSNNINNLSPLLHQFFFPNNALSGTGSAALTAVNSGTVTTGTGITSSLVTGRQIFSQFPFTMQDGGELTATNSGNDSSSGAGNNVVGSTNFNTQIEFDATFQAGNQASITATNAGTFSGSNTMTASNIGYVGNPQHSVAGGVTVGNAFNILVTNTGTDSSTGTATGNLVGFVGDNQIEWDSTVIAGTGLTIHISNSGTNTGTTPGGSTGFADGSMLAVGGLFQTGDGLTITATNSGTNHCSTTGGGGNKVGRLSNDILEFDNTFITGNNSTLTMVNTGICSGAYTTAGNDVGRVDSFHIGSGVMQTGDNFTLTTTNTGSDSSTGVGGNNVGYCGNTQAALGSMIMGNHATITAANSGTYSGSNSMSGNNVGYTGNPQISQSGSLSAQDFFTMTVSNTGNDSSTGVGGNNVGHIDDPQAEFGSFSVGNHATISLTNSGTNTTTADSDTTGFVSGPQFVVGGPFVAGTNLTLSASNTAINTSPSTQVGFIADAQISFQDTCTLGDGALIIASNTGAGTVSANQIFFSQGFTLNGKATFTAVNSGNLSNPGIHISGSNAGGDVDIILQGSSLFIDASPPTFTIGALNGDSGSTAQSVPNLTIQLDSGVTATFAGAIENIMTPLSLTIDGSGTQILTGMNTYSGLTTVQGGTLIVNGTLVGDVVINPLGTFGGNVTAHTVTNNGTISPGASIGTMHFTTYTNNGATYVVEVNGVPQSDLILVDMTATLTGGVVEVSAPDGTYSFQTPYTILQAGTRTGTFSSATAFSPSINPVLTYDGQHVFLTLLADFANVAATHNQQNVANGLDSIVDPTPLQLTLLNEIAGLSADAAADALDSLSGWQYTTNLWFSQTLNTEFLKRLYDPLRFLLPQNRQCDPCDRPTIWMEGGGTFKNLRGNTNAHGLKSSGGEITLGVQKNFGCHWTVGGAASYEHNRIDYRQHGGHATTNSWLGGVYGLYNLNFFYALADAAFGYTTNHMQRTLNVGTLKIHANSHPKMSMATLYAEMGGGWTGKIVAFQPFLGVIGGRNWDQRVHEKGGDGWALRIDNKDCNFSKSRLGVHFTLQPSTAYVCVDAAWDRRLTGAHSSIEGEFVSFGDDMLIEGVSLSRNSFDYAFTLGKTIAQKPKKADKAKHCTRIYVQAVGECWNKAHVIDVLAGFHTTW